MDRIKVLVADGDDASREGVCLMLDDSSYVVAAAPNCTKALNLMVAFSAHVVLVDVHLPDLGGLELTRRIKARWPHARVILLTIFDEYLDEALAAGADAYLLKGSPSDDLQAAIHRVAARATEGQSGMSP